jgi:hypothetical protein
LHQQCAKVRAFAQRIAVGLKYRQVRQAPKGLPPLGRMVATKARFGMDSTG